MALISQIYFWNRTLHVSDRFSVHHESSTVYTARGICHTGFADCLLVGSGCPKHVEFYYKNKFEKLVPSVWFYYKNISRFTVLWMSNSKVSQADSHWPLYTCFFLFAKRGVIEMFVYVCYLIEQWLVKIPGFQTHSNFMNSWQQAVSSHIKQYKQLSTTPVCLTWEVHISNLDFLHRLFHGFPESLQRNTFPPFLSVGSTHLIITV
jgi:hypothetical protein